MYVRGFTFTIKCQLYFITGMNVTLLLTCVYTLDISVESSSLNLLGTFRDFFVLP